VLLVAFTEPHECPAAQLLGAHGGDIDIQEAALDRRHPLSLCGWCIINPICIVEDIVLSHMTQSA
jgi:hypothetical protein